MNFHGLYSNEQNKLIALQYNGHKYDIMSMMTKQPYQTNKSMDNSKIKWGLSFYMLSALQNFC